MKELTPFQKEARKIQEHIKKLRNLSDVVHRLGDTAPWGYQEGVYLDVDVEGAKVDVRFGGGWDTISNLHEARAMLHDKLGWWEDRVDEVFPNAGGGVTAIFTSEREPNIRIIFATKADEFPKSMLPSPDCSIEVEEYTDKRVKISCPVGSKK